MCIYKAMLPGGLDGVVPFFPVAPGSHIRDSFSASGGVASPQLCAAHLFAFHLVAHHI